MSRRIVLVAWVSFFIFALTKTSPVFAGSRDTQYWKTESLAWGFAKNWKMILEEEMYFQDDCSDLYYQHTDLGLIYSGRTKWLDLGFGYRHVLSENKSTWKREERPHISATLKHKWAGYDLSNRSRFECRIREDVEDSWRYRNNMTVKSPWKWTKQEVQPYFTDEFYVDLDKEELNENRMSCGFSFKITEHVGAEIYYMWRRIKSSNKWATHDVVGTRLKLTF
jgi:hypothetical protein